MSTRGYLVALRIVGSIIAAIIAAPQGVALLLVLVGVSLHDGIGSAAVVLTVIAVVVVGALIAIPRVTRAVIRVQLVWARVVWTGLRTLIKGIASRAEERAYQSAVLDATNKKGETS